MKVSWFQKNSFQRQMNVKRQEIACEAFREGAVKDLLHPESRMDSGMWRGEGFWGRFSMGEGMVRLKIGCVMNIWWDRFQLHIEFIWIFLCQVLKTFLECYVKTKTSNSSKIGFFRFWLILHLTYWSLKPAVFLLWRLRAVRVGWFRMLWDVRYDLLRQMTESAIVIGWWLCGRPSNYGLWVGMQQFLIQSE